jgi:hypothetical protein
MQQAVDAHAEAQGHRIGYFRPLRGRPDASETRGRSKQALLTELRRPQAGRMAPNPPMPVRRTDRLGDRPLKGKGLVHLDSATPYKLRPAPRAQQLPLERFASELGLPNSWNSLQR